MVERVNRELGRFFRTYVSHAHKGWAHWLTFIEDCINEGYHVTTEFTPYELQHGVKPKRFWSKFIPQFFNADLTVEEKFILVRERMKNKGEKRAMRVNEGKKMVDYKQGDLVLVRACNFSNAEQDIIAKFLPVYEGPYIIRKSYVGCTFLLGHMESDSLRGKFHANMLRPYFAENGPEAPNQESEEEAV